MVRLCEHEAGARLCRALHDIYPPADEVYDSDAQGLEHVLRTTMTWSRAYGLWQELKHDAIVRIIVHM